MSGGIFVHPVPGAVIKWMARVRAGCLASRARLVGHGMVAGSSACLCCGAELEDEEHILFGCPATGSSEWRQLVAEVWAAAGKAVGLEVPMLMNAVSERDRYLLMGALVPKSLVDWGVPQAVGSRFVAALHRGLAVMVAEVLRRREELQAASRDLPMSEGAGGVEVARMGSQAILPGERRLTVADLRDLEKNRRQGAGQRAVSSSSVKIPAAGEPRRRWLRQRLVDLVKEEMVECPVRLGVQAVAFLELFERRTGEAYSDTPGALVGSRVRGIAKALGNIAREEAWDPPLEKLSVRGTLLWNRQPKEPVDVEVWRQKVEAAEAHSAPVPRLRQQMAGADAGLAVWIKEHRYLVPTDVESGESGMALLMLWEVDHQQAYPSHGGEGLSGALVGFSKRLQERIARDSELSQWLVWKDSHGRLTDGVAPSHHRRWSVRIVAPGDGEPRGWYEEFLARWRAYMEVLAQPPGVRPTAMVTAEQLARVRPEGHPTFAGSEKGEDDADFGGQARRCGRARERDLDDEPMRKRRREGPCLPVSGRKRERSPEGLGRQGKRKQSTLTGWLQSGGRLMSESGEQRIELGMQRLGHSRAESSTPT